MYAGRAAGPQSLPRPATSSATEASMEPTAERTAPSGRGHDPLFILSWRRSGSTLLRYIVDTHPDFASPGEIGIGEVAFQLERMIRATKGEATKGSTEEQRHALAIAETRVIVDGMMGSYLELKGKDRWCDKSIRNLQYRDLLREVFPEARFICLYRDSLDSVVSCLDTYRVGFFGELGEYVAREPYNLVAALTSAWVDHNRQLLDFERQNSERCFRLRYEDLVTEPERALPPLFAFAGAAWDEGLLAAVFTTPHDEGRGVDGDVKIRWSKRIDPSNVGKGERIKINVIPAATRQAIDSLSRELSYPPLAPDRRLPWQAAVEQQAAAADLPLKPFIESYLMVKLDNRTAAADGLEGTCKFEVKGVGGASWRIDFAATPPTITSDGGEAADCSVAMTVEDFLAMITGRLHPLLASNTGNVLVQGDPLLAMKVGRLLYQ